MISTASKLEPLTADWRQLGYELKEVGNKAVLYYQDIKIATFNLSDMLYKNGACLVVQDFCKRHFDNILEVFKI